MASNPVREVPLLTERYLTGEKVSTALYHGSDGSPTQLSSPSTTRFKVRRPSTTPRMGTRGFTTHPMPHEDLSPRSTLPVCTAVPTCTLYLPDASPRFPPAHPPLGRSLSTLALETACQPLALKEQLRCSPSSALPPAPAGPSHGADPMHLSSPPPSSALCRERSWNRCTHGRQIRLLPGVDDEQNRVDHQEKRC